MEVEIHPVSDPSQRTHVWVLPREGKDGTVYAAVFPSLAIGEYAVLEPDGSVATTVAVPPNQVTTPLGDDVWYPAVGRSTRLARRGSLERGRGVLLPATLC